jgi:virulence factor Mce-like protein
MLLTIWLSWAFYTKAFNHYDEVTVTAAKAGLALPQQADVKLRGMIVGIVRDVRVEDDHVVMTLGIDPQLIGSIPRDVRVEVVPKTLFGEKYLSLVPTSETTEHLRAGDAITTAEVPAEFEKFFNDVYPLLTAVPPEKVASTLTALANSLDGKGDALGQTFEDSNEYLEKLNPENKQAIADLVALGQVSHTYANQMDDFGQLVDNSAELSDTVVDKEAALAGFFKEGAGLARSIHDFAGAAGDDVISTAGNSVQPLEFLAEYAAMIPCTFKGTNAIADLTEIVMNNNTIHGAMTIAPVQPTAYDPQTEHPILPSQAELDAFDLTNPRIHGYHPNPADPDNPFPAGLGTVCDELYQAAAGNPRSPDELFLWPRGWWKMFGVKNSHNGNFGTDADFNRGRVADESSWSTALLRPAMW